MSKMPFKLDLTGKHFGDWLVLSISHKNKRGVVFWLCEDVVTGVKRPVQANGLTSGRSKSSGHRHRKAITTHGMTGTPIFKSWESMKQRCFNPNAPDYPGYGGRGIKVHEPWISSFETFYADMGERPQDKTLDRIDVDGNYEPSNCRWATRSEQQRNRRDTKLITYNDESLTVAEWSERTGIHKNVLIWRRTKGWPSERILTTPVRTKRRNR